MIGRLLSWAVVKERTTVTRTKFYIKRFLMETSLKTFSTSRKQGMLRYFKAL